MKRMISLLLALLLALAPVSTYASTAVKAYANYDTYDGLRSSRTESAVEKADSSEKTDELASARQGIYMKDWKKYKKPYVIKVDCVNQLVSVYKMSENGEFDTLVKRFICSTGTKGNDTPHGTFKLSSVERREWRYFRRYKVYVHNAVHIKGDYYFHSIPCDKKDVSTMSRTALEQIGQPASHGCIRMLEEDMKWMFDNCAAGTKVYIMDCEKDDALRLKYMP